MLWPLPTTTPTVPPPLDGRFGGRRKYDHHTGIDIYSVEGAPVVAMETGTVVSVVPFTGPEAGSPWWLPTQAIMILGESGVILYGEMHPNTGLDSLVHAGDLIGTIARVLRHDKGRPTSMLHLELYDPWVTECCEMWRHGEPPPKGLRDPWPLVESFYAQ